MNCKNCNSELWDHQNYCHQCGAKVIRNRLTAGHLASDINEQVLSIDNKFLQTFIDLFKCPDQVIDGYIQGTRKKHINAIQYLAISLTLLGLQIFLLGFLFPDYFNQPIGNDGIWQYYPEDAKEKLTTAFADGSEYLNIFYIIGIPISALITWILFIREKVHNYMEHIVINIYISAQYVICSVVLNVIFAIFNVDLSIAMTIPTILYMLYFGYVLYKLYDLDVGIIILRGILSVFLSIAVVIILVIIMVIVMVIYTKLFR